MKFREVRVQARPKLSAGDNGHVKYVVDRIGRPLWYLDICLVEANDSFRISHKIEIPYNDSKKKWTSLVIGDGNVSVANGLLSYSDGFYIIKTKTKKIMENQNLRILRNPSMGIEEEEGFIKLKKELLQEPLRRMLQYVISKGYYFVS